MGRAGAAFAGAGIALLQERLSIVLPTVFLKSKKPLLQIVEEAFS
jgi:hypothetical protein